MARLENGTSAGLKTVVRQTFTEFADDDCPRLAAALAYYTVFALPPMLVLILAVAGSFTSPDQVTAWMAGQLGLEAAEQIGTMIESAQGTLSGGLSFAFILGIAGLLFSATGAFSQLQRALNTAWDVEPDPEEGFLNKMRSLALKRLMSLGMILVVAFLLVVALALSGLLSAFSNQIAQALEPIGIPAGTATALAWITDAIVSTFIVWLLFSAIFKVLPDAYISWKDVRSGALVAAVLFVIGKMLIGWYIGQSNPGDTFGAAGALAAIMVFIYLASMIVLLGAEFTQVWARRDGDGIRPARHAVKVVTDKRYVRDGEEAPSRRAVADDGRRESAY